MGSQKPALKKKDSADVTKRSPQVTARSVIRKVAPSNHRAKKTAVRGDSYRTAFQTGLLKWTTGEGRGPDLQDYLGMLAGFDPRREATLGDPNIETHGNLTAKRWQEFAKMNRTVVNTWRVIAENFNWADGKPFEHPWQMDNDGKTLRPCYRVRGPSRYFLTTIEGCAVDGDYDPDTFILHGTAGKELRRKKVRMSVFRADELSGVVVEEDENEDEDGTAAEATAASKKAAMVRGQVTRPAASKEKSAIALKKDEIKETEDEIARLTNKLVDLKVDLRGLEAEKAKKKTPGSSTKTPSAPAGKDKALITNDKPERNSETDDNASQHAIAEAEEARAPEEEGAVAEQPVTAHDAENGEDRGAQNENFPSDDDNANDVAQ